MMTRRLRNSLLFLACFASLLAPARASTIVVDAAGGGNFTDIPPAVAAAQPFDVILVQPGSYSSFVVSTNLTILGAGPNVTVLSGSRVHAVASDQRVVLANMRMADLRIENCDGTVVLDGLDLVSTFGALTGFPQNLEINACADVRAIQCSIGAVNDPGRRGVLVTTSRAEFVQSTMLAGPGQSLSCGAGDDGADAVQVANLSRVHLASSSVQGGGGGAVFDLCPSFCNLGAGDGGPGMSLSGNSELFAMGRASQKLKGGFAGDGGDCPCDGNPAAGVFADASNVRWSGCVPEGGAMWCFGGIGPATVGINGSSVAQEGALAPFLERAGTLVPGQPVQFTVTGLPGDVVELRVGRGTALNPIPGVQIEELTTVVRKFQLGTIGASGTVSRTIVPYASLPRGFDFHAQAVVFRGGQELRTNSTPVVLR